jgi:hypothetical protein
MEDVGDDDGVLEGVGSGLEPGEQIGGDDLGIEACVEQNVGVRGADSGS